MTPTFFFRLSALLIFLIACAPTTSSQEKAKTEDHTYYPLTLKLQEDGSKFIRFITWHQVWVTTNNLSENGSKTVLTPSIRRSRFLAYAQVSSRFLILTHFGLNSLHPGNLSALGNDADSPQLFLHGAWTEFRVSDQLYLGGGLHYWNGLTRLASQSTLNFMTLDQSRPFAAWHSLGITDQFGRHLGVYAKGQVGKLDYRLAINSPCRNPLRGGASYSDNSTLAYTGAANLNKGGDPVGQAIYQGYFRYNIWDSESTKLPYNVGTYLGTKKVLAIGGGFFSHPNGMYEAETGKHESVSHLAADIFLDMPVPGGAISAYGMYASFDYGQNYVGRWTGTGSVLYGQLGYFIGKFKIMPYIGHQIADYEGFKAKVTATNMGLNYFILGHNAKLTVEYHQIANDPREGPIDPVNGIDRLSQLRLQAHIFL